MEHRISGFSKLGAQVAEALSAAHSKGIFGTENFGLMQDFLCLLLAPFSFQSRGSLQEAILIVREAESCENEWPGSKARGYMVAR